MVMTVGFLVHVHVIGHVLILITLSTLYYTSLCDLCLKLNVLQVASLHIYIFIIFIESFLLKPLI